RVASISYQVATSSAVSSAAQYFQNKGGLVTNSAGNYSSTSGCDSNFGYLISVSATDGSDNLAGWSSFGPCVDIAAPGVGIYTTTNGGGYGAPSGTSFSSP